MVIHANRLTVLLTYASEQEKNLEVASNYLLAPTIISDAKFVLLDEIIPWFLYEYNSLDEISVQLSDPKLAIEQGVYFHQRLITQKNLDLLFKAESRLLDTIAEDAVLTIS